MQVDEGCINCRFFKGAFSQPTKIMIKQEFQPAYCKQCRIIIAIFNGMIKKKMADSDQGKEIGKQREFKHLVRIMNTDVKGEKHVLYALTRIRGVNVMFANAVLKRANIPISLKAGYLSDKDVSTIESLIQKPLSSGIPAWLLNRRRDVETGQDLHLFMSNLEFTHEMDLKRLKKTKSYKGLRHQWGQPVRGQRTKSNTRKNKGKGSLGVQRKRVTAPAPVKDKKK